MSLVSKVSFEISYRSDHSGVALHLNTRHFEQGLWKFNNSLLKDKTYTDSIKETIKNIKCQYAIPVYNIEN